MTPCSEPDVRFVAHRVRRALQRTRTSVTSRAFRHLVGVIRLPMRDTWFRDLVNQPLTGWFRRGVALPIGSVERAHLLGCVGDASLLVCGFWWEQHQLARRAGPGDLNYYAELGKRAYWNIGDEPYPELASMYIRLTDVMTVLAAHYTEGGNQRVVALCEVQRRYHDARTARILKYLGLPAGFAEPGTPS